MIGPFFVKENGKIKLAEDYENCVFGYEYGCCLKECIKDIEKLVEEARFEGYCEGYNAHQKGMEIKENGTHRRDHPVT